MKVKQHSLTGITGSKSDPKPKPKRASKPKPKRAPNPKPKPQAKRKRKPRAPPRSPNVLGADDPLGSEEPDQALKEIELVPTTQTKNINNWNRVKDKLRLSRPIRHTHADLVPMMWNVLPIYDDRAFEVVEIRLVTSSRCRRVPLGKKSSQPAKNPDGSFAEQQTESWEIEVQDARRRESSTIILFPADHHVMKQKPIPWRGGILETRFCDEEAARRVAQQACDRLNRLPVPIDAELWNSDPYNVPAKMFLEAASMFAIDENFDHSVLDPDWRNRGRGVKTYGLASEQVSIFARDKQTTPLWFSKAYNLLGQYLRINFTAPGLDAARILTELSDAVPDSFHYVADECEMPAVSDLTEIQYEAANLFMRYLQYNTWGLHFDQPALNTWVRRQIEHFALPQTIGNRSKVLRVRRGQTGPCDGDQGWRVVDAAAGVSIRPTKYVADLVEGGELPHIHPATKDSAMIAHVLQSMSLELSTSSGFFNAWQAGLVAAEKINLYMPHMISRARVMEIHCLCTNELERQAASHYCMLDYQYIRCSNGVRLEDGRFVCQECVEKGKLSFSHHTTSALNRAIYQTCYANLNNEFERRGVPFDFDMLNALREHCHMAIIDSANAIWQDAWDGQRVHADARYRDVALQMHGLGVAVPHFLNPSLDRLLPYVNLNGELVIHVAENCVLTTLSLNYLRGSQPPHVIFLMGEARRIWRAEQGGAPRDEEYWRSIYTALDHAMLISQMAYQSRSKRMSQDFSEEDFSTMQACYRSGEFVGTTHNPAFRMRSDFVGGVPLINPGKRQSHKQAAEEWHGRGGRKDWALFTDEDWEIILRIHEQIRASEIYNPRGLRIPMGPGDVPYPFLTHHMPAKTSPSAFRDFISKEFISRWQGMDEWCNWAFVTGNSPKTLFLTCLIWWYSTGGLDEVFGCGITFYTSHMLSISVGRRREVDPGSQMDDGWEDENPTSLDQYNPKKRTLTIQAAATNRMWAATPKEYLDELPDLVLANVRRETEHFDATRRNLPPIRFPEDIAARKVAKFTRAQEPQDDFFQIFGNDSSDDPDTGLDAVSAGGERPPAGTSFIDFEIERFRRRVLRGERVHFNQPALTMLEYAQNLAIRASAEGREFDPMHSYHNDLRAEWIIPLAKIAKDGDEAWTHDDMNTWIIERALGDTVPHGTALLPAAISNWIEGIEEETGVPLEQRNRFEALGNPFNDSNAEHVIGEITRAVGIYCSNSHYVVLAFNFDGLAQEGRIQYWNSSGQYIHNLRRVTRIGPIIGDFLARQMQVSLPYLDWTSTPVEVLPQTIQGDANIDCGPLSINALVNAIRGVPTEIATGRDLDTLVFGLRFRFLTWAFETYMGCPSMVEFIQDHFGEDTIPQYHRQVEALEEFQRRDAERRRRENETEEERRHREEAEQHRLQEEEEQRRLDEEEEQRRREEERIAAGGQPQLPADLSRRMRSLEDDVRKVLTRMTQQDDRLERIETQTRNTGQQLTTMSTNLTNEIRAVRPQANRLSGGQGHSNIGSSSGAPSNPPSRPASSRSMVVPRNNYNARVVTAVDEIHPAYRFAVVSGTGATRRVGYAGQDAFFTAGGEELARYDDSGNVVDVEGQWIGNFMEFEDA